jgi:hypothetical protein
VRFLANENFPRAAVVALRESGHDVTWIAEVAPGSPDLAVLGRAARETRTLLTFDKDFGSLAFRSEADTAVIVFRIRLRDVGAVARFCEQAIRGRSDWTGHFSVIEETRVRMRPLRSTR